MAVKNSGLGRGLDAIYGNNFVGGASSPYITVQLSRLEARSGQPRKDFDEDALVSLADSIKTHGVLQPLVVRDVSNGFYQIVAGERRYRAAKLAGLTEVPAVVVTSDDITTAQLALVENVQREDLNPLEEAMAYRELSEVWGMTQEQISAKIGKSRSAIANAMRLTELPDVVLELVRSGDLSAGHARTLLGLNNREEIAELAEQCVSCGMSVRQLEEAVKRQNNRKPVSPDGEENGKAPLPDYARALEDEARRVLGRRVRISGSGKDRSIRIYYEDNTDLAELLRLLNDGKPIEI